MATLARDRSSRLRRLAVAALVGTLIASLASPAHADPAPVNPTDAQISAAMANKSSAAGDVGRLSAQIVQVQAQLDSLAAQAELKGELYNKAISDLQDAKDAAAAAATAVQTATAQVDAARASFKQFVRSNYMSATIGGTASSLLTSSDPNELFAKADVIRFASAAQAQSLSDLNHATVAKSNAEAAARDAVRVQDDLTTQAETALQAAVTARNDEQDKANSLNATMGTYQQQLAAAQIALTGLQDQRAAYAQWQVEEAARQEAARKAAAAAAAAALAATRSTGSSSAPSSVAPPTAAGNWTPQLGNAAVAAAKSQLGVLYSWAGGNINGPTYGVNSPGTDGYRDSQVFGYDCSGLVLYAWYQAAGLRMPHYAASQYGYGSIHPSNSSLTPGDLLFYSTGGVSGIHHVAMYIGGGQMIEAPYSGSQVRIVSVRLGGDYYGATRPLT